MVAVDDFEGAQVVDSVQMGPEVPGARVRHD